MLTHVEQEHSIEIRYSAAAERNKEGAGGGLK